MQQKIEDAAEKQLEFLKNYAAIHGVRTAKFVRNMAMVAVVIRASDLESELKNTAGVATFDLMEMFAEDNKLELKELLNSVQRLCKMMEVQL
jgi:hypothetical protein